MIFRTSVLAIAVSIVVCLQCIAQVSKVSSEDIMVAAFDMKKASEAADKLAPDGIKYCRWGIASLDTSDLDAAISRFLLNHGSNVPENLLASKMWQVSFVAGDIINQVAMRASGCDLRLRYSDEARAVDLAVGSVLMKLVTARFKFNALAYQQTIRQEQNTTKEIRPGTAKVATEEIIIAAREMKEASEAANKVIVGSQATRQCLQADAPSEAIDLVDLTKLIDYMERVHSKGAIPAANMWNAAREADAAQIGVVTTLEACSMYAAEQKKARNAANEAIQAYHRLTAAIAKFYALAFRQTEWEEQATYQEQPTVREQ